MATLDLTNDLSFMVVTWGLPWWAPAVSDASLRTFLEACQCVTLKPLPTSHTYVPDHSHNNGLTSTEPNTFLSAINNEVGISSRLVFFLLLSLFLPQSLLEGAGITLQTLIFHRSPWQPVISLPLLVSIERRTRRHTGDVRLCRRVGLSFVLVWVSEEQWLLAFPRIPLSSNTKKIQQNMNQKWLHGLLKEVCGHK